MKGCCNCLLKKKSFVYNLFFFSKFFLLFFYFNMRVLLVYYSYMLYDVSTASIANEYGFDCIIFIRSFQSIVASVSYLILF